MRLIPFLRTSGAVAFLFFIQLDLAQSAGEPLPAWVKKAIAERRDAQSPDSIEESTYEGRRVFELNRGDRGDFGDEHVLFEESGREICKFGGFVGQVTSGSCDIRKITYMRTLYSAGQK